MCKMESETVISCYTGVDFSLLPICLGEYWMGKDSGASRLISISELARFASVMELYPDFVESLVPIQQRTTRNVQLRDQFDLVAYMVRNSEVGTQLDTSGASLHFALLYIDESISKDSSTQGEILFRECEQEAEELFCEELTIHRYLWKRDREQLKRIDLFVLLHDKQLNEPQPFLHHDQSYETIKPITLFRQLSITDQSEIANDLWKSIDLERHSALYLVVLKLLFNCSLERTLHSRHPYLIARWGNPMEIAQHIVRQADGSEQMMRILANNYVLVATNVGAPELTSKCLILLNYSRSGMINIAL